MKKSTGMKRAMLLSCAVILLCFTVITGMTWALFTDTERVNTHLQAGDLDITLLRTQLVKTTLNAKGYLEEVEVQKATDPAVNFSQSTRESLLGLTAGEVIVPGTKYVATLRVENHSDVAFGYWIEIKKIHFQPQATLLGQILKLVLGLALVMAIKEGLKPLLGSGIWSGVVRYGLITVFAAGVWPLTFPWFAKLGRKKD